MQGGAADTPERSQGNWVFEDSDCLSKNSEEEVQEPTDVRRSHKLDELCREKRKKSKKNSPEPSQDQHISNYSKAVTD